jgi:DNA-binding NarL/FixJ family response regulator
MLRTESSSGPLAPQPTLADLPTLMTQVGEAGLPVEFTVDGERRELPVGIELSAYRIVQEALTNALKHAGRAHASVGVRYAPDSLELEIADDQALVRVGLRKILENEPQTTVAGEAGDGQDAVAAARRLRPDVVLMDIRMPVLDGIEATRRIVQAQPGTRVLILTTFGLDDYVYDALRAGASGFMLKDAPPEEIAAAVQIVASGDALLAPAVTRAVIEEFTRLPARAQPAVPRAVGELTPREREVLDLLIRGLSNPEICRELVISEATAKTHVARILQKLGLRDRVQAVIYAYETGLVSPGPAT